MKMQKSFKLFAITIMCIIYVNAVAGCGSLGNGGGSVGSDQGNNINTNKVENNIQLTERQISILQEKGLPTEYDKLTDTQKNDIAAIESMLVHLENTYKVKVKFSAFYQGSAINDEQLVAIVNGYNVTVTRTYSGGKFVYEDNYDEVMITEEYENELKKYFDDKELFVQVFAEVSDVKAKDGNALSRVESSNFIFVAWQSSENEYDVFANEFAQWYAKWLNGIFNETRFYFVPAKDILDYGKENYEDRVGEISKEHRVKCVISTQGKITVS